MAQEKGVDGRGANRIGRDHCMTVLDCLRRLDSAVVFPRLLPIPPNARGSELGTDLIHVLLKQRDGFLHLLLSDVNAVSLLHFIAFDVQRTVLSISTRFTYG